MVCGASATSADVSCHTAAPPSEMSRSPAVIWTPSGPVSACHSANVPPAAVSPASSAVPASSGVRHLALIALLSLVLSYWCSRRPLRSPPVPLADHVGTQCVQAVAHECGAERGDQCPAVLTGGHAQVTDVRHVVDDLTHDLLGLDRVVVGAVGVPAGDVHRPLRATELDCHEPGRAQHRGAGDRPARAHGP